MISTFETFLKETHYDGGSLYDTCLINECIVDEDGKRILRCPLTLNNISIKQFEIENRSKSNNYIDICHNEAVSKEKLYYDNTRRCILTAARPQNLFWGEKLGNMQQQDFTINEYLNDVVKKAERIKQELNINRPGQQLPEIINQLNCIADDEEKIQLQELLTQFENQLEQFKKKLSSK
jgi:hypothetical protein